MDFCLKIRPPFKNTHVRTPFFKSSDHERRPELDARECFEASAVMLCISIGTVGVPIFVKKKKKEKTSSNSKERPSFKTQLQSSAWRRFEAPYAIILCTFHKYRHLPTHHSLLGLFFFQVIDARAERELLSHCWCTEFLSNCLSY